jgi:MoxR-like ATPase
MVLGYPSFDEELKIIGSIDSIEDARCSELMTAKQVLRTVEDTEKVYVSDPVKKYIVDLVSHLRESRMLRIKPSPRTTITLLKGARALALIEERDHVLPDDVKFLAPFVFQHRAFLSAEAIVEEISPSSLMADALGKVPVPKEQ